MTGARQKTDAFRNVDPLQVWLEARWDFDQSSDSRSSPETLVASLSDADETLRLLHGVWDDLSDDDLPIAPERATEATQMLGRFRIERLLGQGGMGSVFLAYDPVIDRRMALKVPHPELVLSGKARSRFLREARAAGMMRHPGIVGVYESGEADGVCYIASEYVDGPTLREWMRAKHPVPAELAAKIVAELAAAAHHAHQQGVVHRDLKPGNVLMESAGAEVSRTDDASVHPSWGATPRITDFGLALMELSAEKGEVLTRTGAALGSAEYMSPEQASGKANAVGPATDIHALGVILYELLTGDAPFRRDNLVQTLAAVQHATPVPARRRRRDLPADVAAICNKCLEKQPADRYASANDLRCDLNNFLALRPVTARPIPTTTRFARWARREPTIAVLLSMVLLALCAATLALALHARSLKRHNQVVSQYSQDLNIALRSAEREKANATAALHLSQQHADRVEELLYLSDIVNAYSAWNQGDVNRAFHWLEKQTPDAAGEDAWSRDRRGAEWHLLHALTAPPIATLLGTHAGGATEVAVFPDKIHVATVGMDRRINLWDTSSARCVATIDAGDVSQESLFAVAVSPDGTMMATGSDAVQLWDVASRRRLRVLRQYDYNVESLAFSPDGAHLAVATRYDNIEVLALTGDSVGSVPGRSRNLTIAYTSDHRLLVPVKEKGQPPKHSLQSWDSRLAKQSEGFAGDVHATSNVLAIEVPQTSVCFVSQKGFGWIGQLIDSQTGHVRVTLPGPNNQVNAIAASPDGQILAAADAAGDILYWRLQQHPDGNLSVSEPATIHVGDGALLSIKFIDHERLVSAADDGKIELWQLPRAANPAKRLPVGTRIFAVSPVDESLIHFHSSGVWSRTDRDGNTLWRQAVEKDYFDVTFNHDGTVVACRSTEKEVELRDAATGMLVHRFPKGSCVSPVVASPTSDKIALVGRTGTLRLINSKDGSEVEQVIVDPAQTERRDYVCSFSPDGRFVACGSDFREICIVDTVTSQVVKRLPALAETQVLTFDPRGHFLVSAHFGGGLRIWRWPSGDLETVIQSPDTSVDNVICSLDGKTMVTSGDNGVIRLWSVSHRQELGVLETFASERVDVAFSRDNRRLYVLPRSPDQALWAYETSWEAQARGRLARAAPN